MLVYGVVRHIYDVTFGEDTQLISKLYKDENLAMEKMSELKEDLMGDLNIKIFEVILHEN